MLRKSDFLPLINSRFFALVGDGRVELELMALQDSSTVRMETFSLLFRGPLARAFPQGSYTVTHPQFGEESIFLVPVAREADGMRYEAVFNLMLDQ